MILSTQDMPQDTQALLGDQLRMINQLLSHNRQLQGQQYKNLFMRIKQIKRWCASRSHLGGTLKWPFTSKNQLQISKLLLAKLIQCLHISPKAMMISMLKVRFKITWEKIHRGNSRTLWIHAIQFKLHTRHERLLKTILRSSINLPNCFLSISLIAIKKHLF